MTKTTERSDVQAVLCQAERELRKAGMRRLALEVESAIEAVAELIAEHEAMRMALIKIGNGASGRLGTDQWMEDVARAALARVGAP